MPRGQGDKEIARRQYNGIKWRHSHRSVDDQGQHDVHVSDVFLQIRVGQVQQSTPTHQNTGSNPLSLLEAQTHIQTPTEQTPRGRAHFSVGLFLLKTWTTPSTISQLYSVSAGMFLGSWFSYGWVSETGGCTGASDQRRK